MLEKLCSVSRKSEFNGWRGVEMLKYHQEANENGQGEEMKCHM